MNLRGSAIRAGIFGGTIGAIVNTIGIRATMATGLKPGTGGLAKLVFGRPIGPIGSEVFHLALGIGMAVAYVVIGRDRLPGPGWARGLIFAQIPGVLQLFAVLPMTGHGIAGIGISPVTPILAWSLNALYGAVMGAVVERLDPRS